MRQYDYQKKLEEIWQKAVSRYEQGDRDASAYFQGEDHDFVRSIGATPQEIYDFAEDWVNYREPDFATFALLAEIRRHHFQFRQRGQFTGRQIDTETLPPKTEEADGIVWLPRIIEKARAKLRGELSPDIMYGCGGDRRFFKEHGLHPAEFLRVVEELEEDDDAIVAWVKARSVASGKVAS